MRLRKLLRELLAQLFFKVGKFERSVALEADVDNRLLRPVGKKENVIDRVGRALNADVAEAYSVGQVMQQAIEQTHSTNNQTLINYMHSNTFNTVQGTAKFAADGHNQEGLAYLFQWQNGQLIPVYPESAATQNPEYAKYQF